MLRPKMPAPTMMMGESLAGGGGEVIFGENKREDETISLILALDV